MANFNTTDLEFILAQIQMAETNQPPVSPHLAFGLRQVAGTNNNTVPGQGTFGSVDQTFPRVGEAIFQTADTNPNTGNTTTYLQTSGTVYDSDPRMISNLISDQTANNAAAVQAQAEALDALGTGYQNTVNGNPNNPSTPVAVDSNGNLFIANKTPDAALSAPSNSWFTFFGQFFDHGLDLVNKGGNGSVKMLLAYDDPLYQKGADGLAGTEDDLGADGVQGTFDDPFQNWMTLTRTTQVNGHQSVNAVTPFVDQNQTYTSHPSHQAFLREYVIGVDGLLHSTGKLLNGADGGMATWGDVKANALKFGIVLEDKYVGNVPLLVTDAYGNLILKNGHVQVVTNVGTAASPVYQSVEMDPANPTTLPANTVGSGAQFLNDIAFTANPFDPRGNLLQADTDTDLANNASNAVNPVTGAPMFFNNELLDKHFIAGDGRANENIGLTAVHEIFHSEHNRLLEQTKSLIQTELNNGNVSFAANWVLPGTVLTAGHQITAAEWNGERLFQTAKFGTETQYQHLVFEEFARKVAPTIHLFGNNNIHLDPAVTAEFAHAVYRFGHSMLDENVNRFVVNEKYLDQNGVHTAFKYTDANGVLTNDPITGGVPNTLNANNPLAGTPVLDPNGKPILNEIGLIDAFTNPLEYQNHGVNAAGEIILGSTAQVSNEIDEFVTGALRNNLLGQPLDLAALNIARGRETGVPPLNELRNQLFHQTGDTNLRPYESWTDFGNYLKHAASLINFVAAYGKHPTIETATTLADKRAAAMSLVTMGNDPASNGGDAVHQDAYNFMHSLGAYANDVGDARSLHATWSTGSVTGLDHVDLWIGGLAEKQNLFGGLLGSTFNFIFETQLENLQDGDRLYYLPRIEGIHWGSEIEANSFAEMIIRNTNIKHLPASIFLTPEYTIESSKFIVRDASGNVQYDANGHVITTDPATWPHNAETGAPLVTVLNDGTVKFLGDDNFFGNTMVLGGTEFDDKLEAGHADDDTVWGDGGNDEIDGGGGNDFLYGGTGDDFIHDIAGDDNIHGDEGNDVIDGGSGDDLVFGGDGNDLAYGGQGIDSIVLGQGNDIGVGGEDDDEIEGNEGDDWLEGGDGGDMLVGDQGAPTGQVPLIQGNDVLIGGTQGDKMLGFSGDDIMLGLGGFDRMDGGLGFDWASWEEEAKGVDVDMTRRDFIPAANLPAGDAVRDRFVDTEGASGTRFGDMIRGTDDAKNDPFNTLNNTSLIFGIDDYFDPNVGPVGFSGGNILFGAGGSDFIMGGGGNDIIDGDARLHVELIGGRHTGAQILREIRFDQTQGPVFDQNGNQATSGDIDTAVFRDVSANYQITAALDALGNVRTDSHGKPVLQISHILPNGTVGIDGVDLLFNIERLQFIDTTIDNPFVIVADQAPQGTLSLFDTTPGGAAVAVAPTTVVAVGDTLSVTSTVNDFDGVRVNGVLNPLTAGFDRIDIPASALSYQWQAQDLGRPEWVNISGATSQTFTIANAQFGTTVRLMVSYIDGLGHQETVFSQPTALVTANVATNLAPTLQQQVGQPGLADTTAREDTLIRNMQLPLITTFTDDTTPANLLVYTATLAGTVDGVNVDGQPLSTLGLSFVTIPDLSAGAAPGAILGGRITGTPPANFSGQINVRVTATDAGGLSVQDTFAINVLPVEDGVAGLTIGGDAFVGQTLSANLSQDPDSTALRPSTGITYQWARDGVNILGKTAQTYKLTAADVGHQITVTSKYIDGQGFAETVTSTATALVVDPLPSPPVVTPLTGNIVEDGPSYSQNLLQGALDLNGDTMSVVDVATSITTTGGRVLSLGTDYTITGSNFALTATGFAKFNELGRSATDTAVVNFGVTDIVTGTTPNTLTIRVQGTNDAPVVTGALGVAAIEGGAVVSQSALANASDVDAGDVLTVTGVPATLPAGVTYNGTTQSFSLDPTNAAYNSLRAGATQLVTVSYGVTDGTATTPHQIVFTVTGTNDAPVVTGALGVAAIEGGAVVSQSALANASDVDAGDVLTVTGVPATLPAGVTYNGTTQSFSLDPTNAAYNSLRAGATQLVTVSYGVTDGTATTPHQIVFTVTGTNDAPVVTGALGVAAIEGGAVVSQSALANASDVDAGDVLSVTDIPVTLPSGVSYNAATKVFSFDPSHAAYNALKAGVHQLVTVNYSITDGTVKTPHKVTFDVTGTNDAPINILSSSGVIAENAIDGTLVATLSATDPEGDPITYALADTAEGRFTVVGNQLRVAHGQLLDFEFSTTHNVTVIATDSLGAQSIKTISIGVQDLGEAFTSVGTARRNVITGTANADRIDGRAGNDVISSLGGNDYIDGGAGNDRMSGGAGDDTYVVDADGDTIIEASGNDTVIAKTTAYTLASGLENLINGGTAATFTGTGNAAANVMSGGASTDILSGGDGDDLLIGGSGNDTLNGGNQNDQLFGGVGIDTLSGGAGVDRLDGGAGNDVLSGGLGNDVFSFAAGFGNDRITDFDAGPPGGQDLIDLRALGITDATFAAHVAIADVGADVLITIDANINQTIRLSGINDATTITKQDFLLLGA